MNFHKRVNQLLAEWVSAINALVAIGIPVVGGLLMGGLAATAFDGSAFAGFLGGFIAGGVGGVLVAGSVCGVLAVLIDIRNSLAAQAAPPSDRNRGTTSSETK